MIRKVKKGFTLVELIIVIAVVAILAAVSVVTYLSIVNKARESNDHMVIDQVNKVLVNSQILQKKHTVHEIVERFEAEEGYDVRSMEPEREGTQFVFSYEKGMFGYWKNSESKVVYPKDLAEIDFTDSNDLWFFDEEALESYSDNYSHYLKSSSFSNISVKGGVDVGACENIDSVSLNRSSLGKASKDVVIRTNSSKTTLTINAPQDVVNHYGYAGVVDIIAVANKSYHENGSVAFMEIAKGRVALESNSEVKQIHVSAKVTAVAEDGTKTKEANTFDQVIVALASGVETPDFSRDEVALSSISAEGKLVVEIEKGNSQSDYVYLYQQGLVEQIKVTSGASTSSADNVEAKPIDENAKSGKDTSLADNTSSIAYDIANNLKAGSSVSPEDIAGGTVDVSEIEEAGLNEEAKAEAKAEVIDELAGEEIAENPEIDNYVARIGTQGYGSFDDAYKAAVSGDKIVLLKNVLLGDIIEGNFVQENYTTCYDFTKAGITLDLHGNSLASSVSVHDAFYVKANADLTLKDSVGGGMVLAPNAINVISCFGTFNMYGGTIVASKYDFNTSALRIESNKSAGLIGTANIYGGEISTTVEYIYPGWEAYGPILNFSLNNCGNTYIYGGTFSCTSKDGYYNGVSNCGSLYIKDSLTFEGMYWVNNGDYNTVISIDSGKSLTISGMFTKDTSGTKTMTLTGNYSCDMYNEE